MIILDTNVVSELMRPVADPAVLEWFSKQSPDELHNNAVTLAEILYGIELLPPGNARVTYWRELNDCSRLCWEDASYRSMSMRPDGFHKLQPDDAVMAGQWQNSMLKSPPSRKRMVLPSPPAIHPTSKAAPCG